MNKIKLSCLAAVLVFGGVIAGAEGALAFQGHMLAARGDLQQARTELQNAIPDKAGHRVMALRLVQQALFQTNAGIAAGAQ